MQKYAHIENGVVTNVSVGSPEVAQERGLVELPAGFWIGDLFDGQNFSKKPFNKEERHARLVREATRLLKESAWLGTNDIPAKHRVVWRQWRSALKNVRNLLVDDVTEETSIPSPPEGVEFELPSRANSRAVSRRR